MEVPVEKRGDLCNSLIRLGKLRSEHLEDVDHAIPDLQINLDTGGVRLVGKHHGIVRNFQSEGRPFFPVLGRSEMDGQ